MQSPHISVLLDEVVKEFSNLNGILIDCTLGYGGHSEALLMANPNLRLIACDKDDEAIKFSQERLSKFGDRVKIYRLNFSEVIKKLSTDEIKNVRGILADIGVSSLHLDKDERGFSVRSNALDMRMDKTQNFSAQNVINEYPLEKLAQIFFKYSELVNANLIAKKIVLAREKAPITSAKELSNIIGTNNLKNRNVSVATLAFQAIRIEVNDELGELERLLNAIKNGGFRDCKVAIISFHSLEDRMVKNSFKSWAKSCICPEGAMRCECGANHSLGSIITKKPIIASDDEKRQNSRASCAKMRVFKFKE